MQPGRPESALPGELNDSQELLVQLMHKLFRINALANRARDLFKQNGSIECLEAAIKALRGGLLAHPPNANRSMFLNDLAGALWERYQHNGSLAG